MVLNVKADDTHSNQRALSSTLPSGLNGLSYAAICLIICHILTKLDFGTATVWPL
jgi:hypothetical protein